MADGQFNEAANNMNTEDGKLIIFISQTRSLTIPMVGGAETLWVGVQFLGKIGSEARSLTLILDTPKLRINKAVSQPVRGRFARTQASQLAEEFFPLKSCPSCHAHIIYTSAFALVNC